MAHTFLSLDMGLIPQSTKNNVPTFWKGLFSNDAEYDESGKMTKEPSRMLIDGYNDKRELVHPMQVLQAWTQWSDNPQETITQLLSSAIEYTPIEIKAEKGDINSIWHIEPEVLN